MAKTARRFLGETRGAVTIMVVLFSAVLLTAAGLIIDFGRAFSAHSQMQAFVDKAALAAAQELDGASDAISRASTAANNIAQSSSFIDGDGSFDIEHLIFLTADPVGSDGSFDTSKIASMKTTDPELATHVLVSAAQEKVRVSLLDLRIGNDTPDVEDIPLDAFAVATTQQVLCGGLSTIVMCNPFEDDAAAFSSAMVDNAGYHMELTVDLDVSGDPQLSNTGDVIRLGLMKEPAREVGVNDDDVCSDLALLPGVIGGETDDELERLRDICLLAHVDPGLACVGNELLVKAAHPEIFATGLNTIFDFYDGPMQDVLASDPDVPQGDGSTLPRSTYFAPDEVVVHGRLNFDEYRWDRVIAWALQYSDLQRGFASRPLPAPLQQAAIRDLAENPQKVGTEARGAAAYADYMPALLDLDSRQNYVIRGDTNQSGPMPRGACIRTGVPSTCSLHYGIETTPPDVIEYLGYYQPYLADNGMDGSTLANGASNYYEIYSQVEKQTPDLWLESASNGVDDPLQIASLQEANAPEGGSWEDFKAYLDSTYPGTFDFVINDEGRPTLLNTDIETGPVNFLDAYPTSSPSSEERRRQRVTVINCNAMQTYEAAMSDSDPEYADTYVADVVAVADVFLTEAVNAADCTTDFTTSEAGANGSSILWDQANAQPCASPDLTEISVFAEFISDSNDTTPPGTSQRQVAVLVH
ncbi:MAG: Tad domain-containing protein [Pseudomonadota bacterium]